MSPMSADEILFLVLAAGLRSVIAPLSPRDGNIDLSGVDAVLEVVPVLVEFEVAVPHLRPAWW
jgi:hypothetical protein